MSAAFPQNPALQPQLRAHGLPPRSPAFLHWHTSEDWPKAVAGVEEAEPGES